VKLIQPQHDQATIRKAALCELMPSSRQSIHGLGGAIALKQGLFRETSRLQKEFAGGNQVAVDLRNQASSETRHFHNRQLTVLRPFAQY
jgi:hypothetical protein